jgi:hypothetical protein
MEIEELEQKYKKELQEKKIICNHILITSHNFNDSIKKEMKSCPFAEINEDNNLCIDLNSNDLIQDIILGWLENFLKIQNINSYYQISESWMAKKKENEKVTCKPSEHPERVEALIMHNFSKDMKNKMIINIFKKENDEIVFIERNYIEDNSRFSSRFNLFMEKGSHEEKMNNIIKNT